eukprot:281320_1
MSTTDEVAQNTSIIYFVIYVSVFLLASIYSAYDVYHLLFNAKSNQTTTETTLTTNIELNEVDDENWKCIQCGAGSVVTSTQQSQQCGVCGAAKDYQEEDSVDDEKDCLKDKPQHEEKTDFVTENEPNNKAKSCFKRFKKFMKYWGKSLWIKKSIYVSIIPHLFDQATDIGVLYKYYDIWQNPDDYPVENSSANMRGIFASSIFVIVFYKIISCSAIFALTRKYTDVFLQFLDLMMVRAIYLNYKYQTTEPGNAQRFLQILEATFESAPQIVISMSFVLKTQNTDTIIFISLLSSLWTLVSRVKNDDKSLLKKEWKNLDFQYEKCPPINWRYLFRVICWRFFEITTRIFLISLVWLAIGGFALMIIIAFELGFTLILCFYGEGVIVLGNMMYYTASAVQAAPKMLLQIGEIYKVLSIFMYLSIATCFIMIDFEAWKVPDYKQRKLIIENPVTLFIFIYTWIASVCWVISFFIVYLLGFKEDSFSSRNLQALLNTQQFEELLNLAAFGAAGNIDTQFMKQLISYCTNNNAADKYKILLFQQLFDSMNETKAFDVGRACMKAGMKHSRFLVNYMYDTMEEFDCITDSLDVSTILTADEIVNVRAIVEKRQLYREMKLLYRMSRDGPSNFSKYYNSGKTLTIVHTEQFGDYVCGAYTSVPWSHDFGWKMDMHSFLFTLRQEDNNSIN